MTSAYETNTYTNTSTAASSATSARASAEESKLSGKYIAAHRDEIILKLKNRNVPDDKIAELQTNIDNYRKYRVLASIAYRYANMAHQRARIQKTIYQTAQNKFHEHIEKLSDEARRRQSYRHRRQAPSLKTFTMSLKPIPNLPYVATSECHPGDYEPPRPNYVSTYSNEFKYFRFYKLPDEQINKCIALCQSLEKACSKLTVLQVDALRKQRRADNITSTRNLYEIMTKASLKSIMNKYCNSDSADTDADHLPNI